MSGDKMEEEMDFFDRYRRQKTNGEKKRKEMEGKRGRSKRK